MDDLSRIRPCSAPLVGQYFLQVSSDAVWRQGQILAVHNDDGVIEVALLWFEPNRSPELACLALDSLEQFALFDTLEEMQAGYEWYHPGELAEWAEVAARGTVH